MSEDKEIQELRKEVRRLRRLAVERMGRSYYVAMKDDRTYDVGSALDKLKIEYDVFGHDREWSVMKMSLPRTKAGRTYEGALDAVGVDASAV